MHHIGPDEVFDAPRFSQAVFHVKQRFPAPDILIAHAAAFERLWLAQEFPGVPWLCSWKAALRIWPNAPRHSSQVLRYWLGLNVETGPNMPAHRALADCSVTVELVRRLMEHATLKQMAEWEKEPAALPSLPFGKHRGLHWADVPLDYLGWVLTRDFGPDILFCVKKELNRRVAIIKF